MWHYNFTHSIGLLTTPKVPHAKANDVRHFLLTEDETEPKNSEPAVLIKWQCQDLFNTSVHAQPDSIAGMSVKSGQKYLLTFVLPWRALEDQF